jgi:type IV secretory pathway VirB4 component
VNSTPLAYKHDERFQHTYVIGATGSGKSTLMLNLITQDIHHGYGIIVLSPEDDLFDKLLAYIPASRKNDLIYLDPTDIK